MSVTQALEAALRFDPWKHPLARRAGVAIHVLRGLPVIYRVHLDVNGGIELRGRRNNRVWMRESSLTRAEPPPLITLESHNARFENSTLNGGGYGTGMRMRVESPGGSE